MNNVLAVIPARGGSKGVPRKNIREVGGKPLIAWTIEAALSAQGIGTLVCSTDDAEIASICEASGLPVPHLRPAELAQDDTRIQDVILNLLESHTASYEYVLLLQPTAPLRTGDDIEAVLSLAEKYDATSVVSFTRAETHHPYYMYAYHEGNPPAITPFATYEVGLPRQKFPPVMYRNGAIYLVKMSYFLEKASFVSPDVVPYLMPPERSVNVDTEEDFDYLRWRMECGRG